DEDGNSLLVGRWEVTSETWLRGLEVVTESNSICGEKNFLELKSNGTYSIETNGCSSAMFFTEHTGNYTSNGFYLTLKAHDNRKVFLEDSSTIEFSYSVTSNTLKLTHSYGGEDGTDDSAFNTVWTFKRM